MMTTTPLFVTFYQISVAMVVFWPLVSSFFNIELYTAKLVVCLSSNSLLH